MLIPETKEKDKLTIRSAIEKIRFLTLTPQQFAEGPARSSLLTESEAFAVLMNILSSISDVAMPSGFSMCRVPRKQLIGGGPSSGVRDVGINPDRPRVSFNYGLALNPLNRLNFTTIDPRPSNERLMFESGNPLSSNQRSDFGPSNREPSEVPVYGPIDPQPASERSMFGSIHFQPSSGRSMVGSINPQPSRERSMFGSLNPQPSSERSMFGSLNPQLSNERSMFASLNPQPTSERSMFGSVNLQSSNQFQSIFGPSNQETLREPVFGPIDPQPPSGRSIFASSKAHNGRPIFRRDNSYNEH